MPFANEHSARLRNPDDFAADSFRRTAGGKLFGRILVPATVGIIWGKLKGRSKPSDYPIPQALRFPTASWSADKARAWLHTHNVTFISFEPARTSQGASPNRGLVVLSHALLADGLKVDRQARIISGVSVITRGPAAGHGFDIDDVMLSQVHDAIGKAAPRGIKSHLTHAEQCSIFAGGKDPVEVMVGRCRTPRLLDGHVRADIHIGAYADKSPSGQLGTYLMDVAEEDPEAIGLSIVFERAPYQERRDENNQTLPPFGRIRALCAVDFVGDPGANPDGLL